MESAPLALTPNVLALARLRPGRHLAGRLRLTQVSREFVRDGEFSVFCLTDGVTSGLFVPGSQEVQTALDVLDAPVVTIQFYFCDPFFIVGRLLTAANAAKPSLASPALGPVLAPAEAPALAPIQTPVLAPARIPALAPALASGQPSNRLEVLLDEWRSQTFGTPTHAISGRILGVSPLGPIRDVYCCWAVVSANGEQRRIYFFGAQALDAQERLREKSVFRFDGVTDAFKPPRQQPSDEQELLFAPGGLITFVPPTWDRFNKVSQRDPAARALPVHSLSSCRYGDRVSILGTVVDVRSNPLNSGGNVSRDILHVTDSQSFCEVELRSLTAGELGVALGDALLLSGLRVEAMCRSARVARVIFDSRSVARWNPFFPEAGGLEGGEAQGTRESQGAFSCPEGQGRRNRDEREDQAARLGRPKRVKTNE